MTTNPQTSLPTATKDQIRALREEALRAGDTSLATTCFHALHGNATARDECASVIAAAAAMDDEPAGDEYPDGARSLDYAQREMRSRLPACARCARDIGERLIRALEDGGPQECACGLAIPTPDAEWMRDAGYNVDEDDDAEEAQS